MELHDDGEFVTLHFKFTNAQKKVKISNITKGAEEQTLIPTYEEAFLYPIDV